MEKETYPFFCGEGRMIANNIIHRDTNRKCNTTINNFAVNLFLVQFGSLCLHNRVAEFAKINDLGSRNALGN